MRVVLPLTVGLGLALLGQTAVPTDAPPVLVFDTGGHTGRVQGLVFTPDGSKLVSAAEDKTVRVWDIESGACERVIRPPVGAGPEGMLYAAALTADGKTLAIAGFGYKGYRPIFLIDFITGEIRAALTGHTSAINGLAFSPDGTRLASAGFDRVVRLWDVTTGQSVAALDGHSDAIYGVAFAPDGRHVVTVSDDKTGRIWDVAAGRQEAVLQGHTDFPRSVSWSPDGTRIATGSEDGTILFWGPRGERVGTFTGLQGQVNRLQFMPDSRTLAVAHDSGKVRGAALVDVAAGRVVWDYTDADSPIKAVACNPKRPVIAAGAFSGEVLLLDTQDGKVLSRLGASSQPIRSVGWSRQGQSLAWRTTAGREAPFDRSFDLFTHQLHENPGAEFLGAWEDPDGARIAYGNQKEVRVLPRDGAPVTLSLSKRGDVVHCFTLLPGKRAVVGSAFGLTLFDSRTGRELQEYVGHVGAVFGIAVSADGRFFATAGNDHTLRVWRPEVKGPLISLLFAGNEWIAWHGNGYYASSAGGENMMGWLLGRGRDKTGLYCPSAQVRKKLHRPELIKALAQSGDLQQALAAAERVTGKTEPVTKIVEVLPPAVSILKPTANPLESDDETIEISAEARTVSDFPITNLRVLLDGRPIPNKEAETAVTPPKKGTVRADWKVKVPQGQHELVVQADSTGSKGISQPIVIARTTRGFKAKPGATEKGPMPSLFVLAVGIADYPGELRLNYPADDAKEFAKTLHDFGKPLFKDIQTKVLTDKEATRISILEGLKWLRREATQHDYSVVFFAGHGERDTDSGSYYLLPHDVNPKFVAASGCSGNDLKTFLANVPGKILVVLDACHAGAFGGVDKKRSLPDDVIRDLVSGEVGVAVMASSMAGEVSRESKKFGHGYFTQALLEGLKGQAADPKGFVYITALDLYVTNRVKELTQGEQHPVINRPLQSFPLTAPKLVKKAG